MLEKDQEFQKDMFDCINIMQRMPNYKNKVWEKISQIHNTYEEQKGAQGMLCGELAKQRLAKKEREEEEKFEKGLEALIGETAKTSALKAMNLN